MDIQYICWKMEDLCKQYRRQLEDDDPKAVETLTEIQELTVALSADVRKARMDSAFFSGELDEKTGERNVRYPGDPREAKQFK